MKRRLAKLSDTQATLLISGFISLIFLGLSAIGFAFNQPGWMIGVAVGAVSSIAYISLTIGSSDATLKESKAGLYILFYFLKMFMFAGFFCVLVILDYKLHIAAFKNSYWGMIIAFFPTVIIVVATQLMSKGENDGQVH